MVTKGVGVDNDVAIAGKYAAPSAGLSVFWTRLYAAYCYFSFSHLTEIFEKAAAQKLDPSSARDSHPADCNPKQLSREFDALYRRRRERGKDSNSLDVLFVLAFQEKLNILQHFLLLVIETIVRFSGPFVLKRFVIWIEDYRDGEDTIASGSLWGTLLTTGPLLYTLLHHRLVWVALKSGCRIRATLGAAAHAKMLRLNSSSVAKITTGHVVNMAGNDLKRFDSVVGLWPHLFLAPLEGFAVLAVVSLTIGIVPALAGMAFIFSIIPMQFILSKYIRKLRAQTAVVTDKRVNLTGELISGNLAVKMLGWEDPLTADVKAIRQREHRLLTLKGYIKALNASLPAVTRALAICAMFVTYSYTDGEFNTPDIFFALSLLMLLRMSVCFWFVRAVEMLPESPAGSASADTARHGRIEIRDGNFGWFSQSDDTTKAQKSLSHRRRTQTGASKRTDAVPQMKQTLHDINLVVQPGELVGIVGKVGSGKSSLLAALLNDMENLSGTQSARLSGKVSFCSQTPWIVSGSVRENVLFGRPFEKDLYDAVVHSCALAVDFDQFPSGDSTELGERGINISGGQKARVALARAAYSQADIHLLDDPLSAVDPHVGRVLFDRCIGRRGVMGGSTRLLVTHQRRFLPQCDRIVVMAEGRIEAVGTWEQLADHEALKNVGECCEHGETCLGPTEGGADVGDGGRTEESKEYGPSTGDRQASGERQLVKAEGKEEGTVDVNVYWAYVHHIGAFAVAAVVVVVLAAQSCYFLLEWWVAKWSSVSASEQQETKWVTVLLSLTGGAIAIQFVGVFALFAVLVLGSTRLHDQMLQSVVHAPMKFFHTNPTGRILNRFSKDMGLQDEEIPFIVSDILLYGSVVCGTLVFAAIALPYVLIFFALIAWFFLKVRRKYSITSSEIKRFDGITRSPVYAMLSANIRGLSTIRAYGMEAAFQERFVEALDLNGTWRTAFCQAGRWLAFRMDGITSLVTMISAILAVALAKEVSDEVLGLALTYISFLSGTMQWTMRQTAELENAMTSVERNMEYTRLEQEPPTAAQGGGEAPSGWPTVGSLEYKSVTASYRPGLDPVLKDLCFAIPGGSSVGIVGRTGSGKSSLLLTLFRLIDMNEGEITLDGVDTAEVGIDVLRKQLAVIPQDPVLFGGTLRPNLDPWNQHSDARVWDALEKVCLDSTASELGGLDAGIAECGGNLSVGQRQLLCLARSLLSDAKVLALDEATANVDRTTDALIQKSLHSLMSHSKRTLLIIAHRIDTVMDCDLLLVLENGELECFDLPERVRPHLDESRPSQSLVWKLRRRFTALAETLAVYRDRAPFLISRLQYALTDTLATELSSQTETETRLTALSIATVSLTETITTHALSSELRGACFLDMGATLSRGDNAVIQTYSDSCPPDAVRHPCAIPQPGQEAPKKEAVAPSKNTQLPRTKQHFRPQKRHR